MQKAENTKNFPLFPEIFEIQVNNRKTYKIRCN